MQGFGHKRHGRRGHGRPRGKIKFQPFARGQYETAIEAARKILKELPLLRGIAAQAFSKFERRRLVRDANM
jgi:hypothetical protein